MACHQVELEELLMRLVPSGNHPDDVQTALEATVAHPKKTLAV